MSTQESTIRRRRRLPWDMPLGNDLPEDGGITGRLPYEPHQLPPITPKVRDFPRPAVVPISTVPVTDTLPPIGDAEQPDDLTRARDAVTSAQNAPLEDVPRWKAALMTILRNLGHVNARPLERGESAWARILGNVAGSGAAGAIEPKIESQVRHDQREADAIENYNRQVGMEKAVVGIDTAKTQNEERRARIPGILAKPILERDKFEQKRDFDEWRMKSGDEKAENYETWLEWRMANGDRSAKTREDYVKWQQDIGERRLGETQRHNKAQEALGVVGIDVRREGNQIRREAGEARQSSTTGNPARDRSNAQRLLNQARAYRVRAAAAKTEEAAAELNATAEQFEQDVASQYPDYVEAEAQGTGIFGGRVGKAPTRLKMKGGTTTPAPRAVLTEAEIMAKFPGNPLKAAEAIKRARAKGLLK